MIRWMFATVLSVILCATGAHSVFAQSDIVIDIYEPGTSRIKIGVPPFVNDPVSPAMYNPALGTEIAGILRDDLSFTGLFTVFDAPARLPGSDGGSSGFAPLKAWVPLDVQAVVQGVIKSIGGKIRLDCSLYDVESESRIVGKYYMGAPDTTRRNVHRFADEIVYRYTGTRGVAHTSIAYVKQLGANKEIHIMDYDGHNAYRLTYDKSIALSPTWSPDGTKLAFTSYKDRNPDIHIVDLERKSYRRLSGFIGLNTTPVFSPDGRTLALTLSKDGNPEIYLLALKTGELTRLTRNSRIDTSPTWSPNGRELAFVSDRSGYPQIYIMDREGGNLRRLTYTGYYNTSPAWSPEGDKIAYVSTIAGKGEIVVINPRGSEFGRLTYTGGNEDPCWSPNGKYLAYSSKQGGVKDIYLMRADGSGRRRITFGGGDNMAPAWSP
jgi:TolB protein